MNYVMVETYHNYVDAHIAMGLLESHNINAWLKDEHTVSINPMWSNAVGGIKLMVPEVQVARAMKILEEIKNETQQKHACPQCGSTNVAFVSTPRKPGNWLSFLWGIITFTYAPPVEKTWHCFDCEFEYS